ncbi:phage antirepressor N-terminal domain-containing protein [Herbaspirillum huttiense]|uniref:phage antirepressor N-terminal domain-containing protein n=1 Tax=Herbaspirillum huttiense TaxID=863372 RepID=UPI003F3A72DD
MRHHSLPAHAGQIQPIHVPFHGSELYLVSHEDQPYVPMRPVVRGIGLDWKSQHRKLTETRFSSSVVELTMQLPGDYQRRAVTCMALRKLPGWLMSIEPRKVIDVAIRAKVIEYQNECDDVLWKYWTEGVAANPRAESPSLDHDTLMHLSNHMLWLRAWWSAHGDAIRSLNPNMGAALHDHFIEGAMSAWEVARKVGFTFPQAYAQAYPWQGSSQERLAYFNRMAVAG